MRIKGWKTIVIVVLAVIMGIGLIGCGGPSSNDGGNGKQTTTPTQTQNTSQEQKPEYVIPDPKDTKYVMLSDILSDWQWKNIKEMISEDELKILGDITTKYIDNDVVFSVSWTKKSMYIEFPVSIDNNQIEAIVKDLKNNGFTITEETKSSTTSVLSIEGQTKGKASFVIRNNQKKHSYIGIIYSKEVNPTIDLSKFKNDDLKTPYIVMMALGVDPRIPSSDENGSYIQFDEEDGTLVYSFYLHFKSDSEKMNFVTNAETLIPGAYAPPEKTYISAAAAGVWEISGSSVVDNDFVMQFTTKVIK